MIISRELEGSQSVKSKFDFLSLYYPYGSLTDVGDIYFIRYYFFVKCNKSFIAKTVELLKELAKVMTIATNSERFKLIIDT